MARPKKSDEAPKKFDVSKPGRAKPSATSRPLIVSSRPIMRDPMVRDENANEEPPKASDTSDTRMKKLMSARRSSVTINPDGQNDTDAKPSDDTQDEPATVEEEGKSLDELAAEMNAKPETSDDKPVDKPAKKSKAAVKAKKEVKTKDNTKNEDDEADSVAIPVTVGKKVADQSVTTDDDETSAEPNVEDDEIKLDEDDKPTFLADDPPEDTNKPKPTKDEEDTDKPDVAAQTDEPTGNVPEKAESKPEAPIESTTTAEPKAEPEKTDEKDSVEPNAEGAVDAVAQQAAAKKEQTALSKEEEAYNAKVQKLVESKQYVVPIGHLRRRKHAKIGLLVTLLLAVLGIIALNFALDAGYLNFEVPYLPLTNVL